MHFRTKTLSGVLTRTLGLVGFCLRWGGWWALWSAGALRALGPVFGSPVLLPLSVVLPLHRLNSTESDNTYKRCDILYMPKVHCISRTLKKNYTPLHLFFIALLFLCSLLRDLHLPPVKHMINIQNKTLFAQHATAQGHKYRIYDFNSSAGESVSPAKCDMQPHYSFPDITGIKAPRNLSVSWIYKRLGGMWYIKVNINLYSDVTTEQYMVLG